MKILGTGFFRTGGNRKHWNFFRPNVGHKQIHVDAR